MKKLHAPDKLQLLQNSNPLRPWFSLDEKRQCVLCDRTFTGHRVRVTPGSNGNHTLHCPTKDCPSTPREWVAVGNPLTDPHPWTDWLRILDEVDQQQPVAVSGKPPRRKAFAGFAD